MTGTEPILIRGAFSSPYSMKMRGVLRYRHIPHRWVPRGSVWDTYPPGDVPVIPVLIFPGPDGDYTETLVDSSPQIVRLEADHDGRSIVPADPALAMLDMLLEDFADEWLTKAMYHYRWAYEPDTEKAGRLLPIDADLTLDDERASQLHDYIIERQVGRRALVGSTDENTPVIEDSFRRLLGVLQDLLGRRPFVFGERPARTDFALFGQLKPMVWWDPTPSAVVVDLAPKVPIWVERLDDLSWWPGPGADDWDDLEDLDPAMVDLLHEAGRTYAPFMVANGAALDAGADEVVCEIDGRTYRQAPFKYQGKTLRWLREAYDSLAGEHRARVDGVLAGTGCERLFASGD